MSGGLVRCICLASLLTLARGGPPTPASWSGLVEVEARTGEAGRYEFPYLDEGSRTICVSAPGLAPAVQSLIVVQDGSGPRVDVNLDAPETLLIRLKDADNRGRRIHLVPYRWWPELFTRDIEGGEAEVEFPGLGGPFRKGLILVSGQGDPSGWKVAGAFDLDRSHAVTVSCAGDLLTSQIAVPEAECLAPWGSEVSEASRLFFGMLTPAALFWRTDFSPKSSVLRLAGSALGRRSGGGGLHGYARSAFLPVLIESRDGGAWLEWTSGASEFELGGVPAGMYRVRALNYSGSVTFARGLVVPPSGTAELATGLGEEIDLGEPLSRGVMGIVRWEDGRPVEGAEVFFQDAANFRRFLRRVVTDRNGYYQIPNVPGDAAYLAFGLPPKDVHAMKRFVFPQVEAARREIWLDLILSPHRVVGRAAEIEPKTRLDLICEGPEGRDQVVWSTFTDETGKFAVTNVPHGRFVVRAAGGRASAGAASLPFNVGRDTSVVVHWPESRRSDPLAGPPR